jgi:hypothetical protein
MFRLARLFVVPIASALIVLRGSVVSAVTSVNGRAGAKFTVPVSASISQGSDGTCRGGICDFGNRARGLKTPTLWTI